MLNLILKLICFLQLIWALLQVLKRDFSFWSVLKEKQQQQKGKEKLAKFHNWLKTHSKVVNAQNKRQFYQFWGMLAWKKWFQNFHLGTQSAIFLYLKMTTFDKNPHF